MEWADNIIKVLLYAIQAAICDLSKQEFDHFAPLVNTL